MISLHDPAGQRIECVSKPASAICISRVAYNILTECCIIGNTVGGNSTLAGKKTL